jgi:hypothetical protein
MIGALIFLSLPIMARSADLNSLQLQQLISNSEKQIEELKTILSYTKQDSSALEKAGKLLESLTAGINQTLAQYQSTEAYQKALVELQSKDSFGSTYSNAKKLNDSLPEEIQDKGEFKNLIEFQKQTVQANQVDVSNQAALQEALKTAQPGFIPKLQTQTQIGNWQTGTRLSTQMTELLSTVEAMRQELRLIRLKEQQNGISALLKGSSLQNERQREVKFNGLR